MPSDSIAPESCRAYPGGSGVEPPVDRPSTSLNTSSSILILLRLEGAALLVAAILLNVHAGGSWRMAAALFFVPDLSLLAFLWGPRAGVLAYNATHSTLGGVGLAMGGALLGNALLLGLAAIWLGHVGFDRMLGYGLKHAASFHHTHLGVIGKARRTSVAVPAARGEP